jgi:hypothetical protein
MLRQFAILTLAALVCCAPALGQTPAVRPAAAPGPPPPAARLAGDPARLFPADTPFYVEVGSLATLVETIGDRGALLESVNDFLGDTGAKSENLTDRELGLLLDSSGVAAFVSSGATPYVGFMSFMTPNVAVVRLGSDEAVAILRDRVLARYAGTQTPKVETIAGHSVTHLEKLSYLIDGRTIICGAPDAIAKILETAADSKAKRLGDEPGFLSAAAKQAGVEQLGRAYVGGRAVARSFSSMTGVDIQEQTGESPDEPARKIPEEDVALYKTIGPEALLGGTFALVPTGLGVALRYDIEIDRARPGVISVLSNPPALAFRSASHMPRDVESLQIVSVDPVRIYSLFQQHFGPLRPQRPDQSTFSSSMKEVEAIVGMSLGDELLPALGNEAALAMRLSPLVPTESSSDGEAEGAPPVASPFDVVFVEVRNREVVRRAISSAVSRMLGPVAQGVTIEPTLYKGAEIWQAPGMVVALGDDFALGGDEARVKASLDAIASGETLATSEHYQSEAAAWGGDAIYVTYQSPKYDEAMAKLAARTKKAIVENGPQNGETAEELEARAESIAESNRSSFFGGFTSSPIFRDATGVHWQGGTQTATMRRGFTEFVRDVLVESPRRDRRSKSESTALDLLRSIADAEQTYRERKGRFASLEELRAEKALDEEALALLEKNESGYKFAVAVSGAGDDARYHVTATPAEYGRWGRISYFVDETRKLRAADKKGDPANASDDIYGGYDPSLDAEPVVAEPDEATDPDEIDDLDESGDFDEP